MPDWKCWKSWLVIVMAVALSLRVGAAVSLQHRLDHQLQRQFLIEGDANGYWLLAKQLAGGKPLEIYDPPRRVMRMPGFPWLLSLGVRAFGDELLLIRLSLAVVGSLACLLVFWLGWELADPPTAVVAAGLTAISPAAVGFTPLILSETLFAALLAASLIPMAKLIQHRTRPPASGRCYLWALAAGLLVGVASLVRPSWMPVAPLFAGMYWWFAARNRRGLILAGIVLLGLVVSLLPWTVRNYRVTGHVVAATLWAGPSLYDGFNPQADGGSDMSFIERDGVYQRMSEYDADRYYRRAAWNYAAGHPHRVLQLAALKLARFWSPWPNAEQFRSWRLMIPLGLFFGSAVLLAIYGGWRSRQIPWLCVLAAGPVIYFSCLHTLFVGSIRYRLPAEYPLMILAAVGIQQLWGRQAITNSPALSLGGGEPIA